MDGEVGMERWRPAPRPPSGSLTLETPGQIARGIHGSADRFRAVVWPVVRHAFGPGQLIQVEDIDGDLPRRLDYLGIDYFFDPLQGEAFGLGTRVQRCNRQGQPWDSFSMSEGQYERLRSGSALGRILPAVAIQAFMTETWDRLLSIGVVRLADLAATQTTGCHNGPTGPFRSWSFSVLAAEGALIARFPEPRLAAPFGACTGLNDQASGNERPARLPGQTDSPQQTATSANGTGRRLRS